MLPILFTLGEEATHLKQHNFVKVLTTISLGFFPLVHPECFFIHSNMQCHKLVSNWFFKFDIYSNHISWAPVVMLKTFDTSISIQTSTSILLCTHILTFSWPLKLGNFISVFFISASGGYMDIAIVLSLSFTLCICVAILQTLHQWAHRNEWKTSHIYLNHLLVELYGHRPT